MIRFDRVTLALVWTLSACGGESASLDSRPTETVLERLDTLVTTESALISHPTDIAVAPDGEVYVADYQSDRILRLNPREDLVQTIGRTGDGPGEFDGPTAVRATASAVWVVDRGNGRLQTLSRDGEYVSMAPLGREVGTGLPSIGPNGSLVVGTMGSNSALAARLEPSTGEASGIGVPVVEPTAVFDITAIKDRISRGEIPDEFRNAVLVSEDRSGSIWMALQSQAEIRRFAPDGSSLWTLTVESEELDAMLADFFLRNEEEERPFAVIPLRYFDDIQNVGEDLWVLLNTPPGRPATILQVSSDGRQVGSLIVPGAPGANTLAFDAADSVLYLGTPDDAQVVMARVRW